MSHCIRLIPIPPHGRHVEQQNKWARITQQTTRNMKEAYHRHHHIVFKREMPTKCSMWLVCVCKIGETIKSFFIMNCSLARVPGQRNLDAPSSSLGIRINSLDFSNRRGNKFIFDRPFYSSYAFSSRRIRRSQPANQQQQQ